MAKRFKEAANAAKPVYRTIIGNIPDTSNAHDAHDAQHTQEVGRLQEPESEYMVKTEEDGKDTIRVVIGPAPATQGRRGAGLPRINMAFTEENLEYLRLMAGLRGQSMTRYVNALLEKDRAQNEELYSAAQQLADRGQ